MIYDDRHMFVEIPKCASTYVQNHLFFKHGWRLVPPEPFGSWQHRPWCLCPESIRDGREAFAVMRNPWAWYRSLYHYSMRTGYMNQWEPGRHHDFQSWLALLLDGKGHPHLPQGQKLDTEFFECMARWGIGYLTFSFILQCGRAPGQFIKRVQPPEDVELAVRRFLLVETIEAGMVNYLGIDPAPLALEPRANVSTEGGHYSRDYTPELAALVGHKERLICERFGYRFEVSP